MKDYPTPRPPRAGRPRGFLALGVALLAACGSGTTMPAQTPDDVRDRYPDIPSAAVQLQAQPVMAVTTPISQITDTRRTVITTAEEWSAYWTLFYGNVSPTPEVAVVDFAQEMVVVATSGTRPTGGFMIQIEGVYEANGEVLVAVLETRPGSGCMTTQSLTAPATAVRMARSDLPVRFTERAEDAPCT